MIYTLFDYFCRENSLSEEQAVSFASFAKGLYAREPYLLLHEEVEIAFERWEVLGWPEEDPRPTPVGYFVLLCPDFYVMPAMSYDQVFLSWDEDKTSGKKCPKYWYEKGWPIYALVPCPMEEARMGVLPDRKYDPGTFGVESLNACLSMDLNVIPVKRVPLEDVQMPVAGVFKTNTAIIRPQDHERMQKY